jgi:hypothetical protein
MNITITDRAIFAYAVGSWIWAAGNCLNGISSPLEYWWRTISACAATGAAICCVSTRLSGSKEAQSWAGLLAIVAGSLAQPTGQTDPSMSAFARVALAAAILAMHGREWRVASWWLAAGPVALLAGISTSALDAASIGLCAVAAVAMLAGGRLPLPIGRTIAACAIAPSLVLCAVALGARIDLILQVIVYVPIISLAFIGSGRSVATLER